MQIFKNRGIVLNGMGGDDGEAFQATLFKRLANFLVTSFAEY